tara:strand:- start:1507 stop:1977 length:471 start_codon:yes stop_codon:yes gene_type:complete
MENTKQILFIDSNGLPRNGTFEKFYAEGVIMYSNPSVRLVENEPQVDDYTLNINGYVIADKFKGRSDERLKSDISNISNGLELIKKLTGKSYKLRNDDNISHGLIAQEVQNVLPSITSIDDDGYLNINYIELIPFLIESIKKLDDKLNLLINSINA